MINLNVVTCGRCGRIFAHELTVSELTCPYCKFNEDVCHFPDYFYSPEYIDSYINLSDKDNIETDGGEIKY